MADQPYDYGGDAVDRLILTVSRPRFTRYRESVDNDAAALQHYTWNTAVAAAFYGPLQTLEITLRNAVHDAMRTKYGEFWFDTQLLRSADRHKVDQTVQYLHDRNGQPTADRVVAELPFGFWVTLFANPYDTTIWRTDLHHIFEPRVKDRRGLHDALDRLRTLRNRIAHHEPISHRNLDDDYRRIRNIVEFLSTPTLSWLDHHSRVPEALTTKPDSLLRF